MTSFASPKFFLCVLAQFLVASAIPTSPESKARSLALRSNDKASVYIPKGVPACNINGTGFNVQFYQYGYGDDAGLKDDFFTGAYKTTSVKNVTGISNLIYEHGGRGSYDIEIKELYGEDISVSNFAMDISGFFKAPISGEYHFNVKAKNIAWYPYGSPVNGQVVGASLQFGAQAECTDSALECVSDEILVNTVKDKDSDQIWYTMNLTEGKYYPVKLVSFARSAGNMFLFSYLDPEGMYYSGTFHQSVFQGTFGNCS